MADLAVEDQVIVVTVLKGREFPRRAHQSLLVLGKFDGEELSADPVRHDDTFEIQNELVAWPPTAPLLLLCRTPFLLLILLRSARFC